MHWNSDSTWQEYNWGTKQTPGARFLLAYLVLTLEPRNSIRQLPLYLLLECWTSLLNIVLLVSAVIWASLLGFYATRYWIFNIQHSGNLLRLLAWNFLCCVGSGLRTKGMSTSLRMANNDHDVCLIASNKNKDISDVNHLHALTAH